jgi:hypothetical protein
MHGACVRLTCSRSLMFFDARSWYLKPISIRSNSLSMLHVSGRGSQQANRQVQGGPLSSHLDSLSRMIDE